MITVEIRRADGSFKSYEVGESRRGPRRSRRLTRFSAPAVLQDGALLPEVRLSLPSTWADTHPLAFDRFDRRPFHDTEYSEDDLEDLAIQMEESFLERLPGELEARQLGRENRRAKRTQKRRGKLPMYDLCCRLIGYRPVRASTHKLGNPSGRKLRQRDVERETFRCMQPAEVYVHEPRHWVDELPLPDLGLDDVYVEEIMLPIEELVAA